MDHVKAVHCSVVGHLELQLQACWQFADITYLLQPARRRLRIAWACRLCGETLRCSRSMLCANHFFPLFDQVTNAERMQQAIRPGAS